VVEGSEGPADVFASACIEVAIVTPSMQEDNDNLSSLFEVCQRLCSLAGAGSLIRRLVVVRPSSRLEGFSEWVRLGQ